MRISEEDLRDYLASSLGCFIVQELLEKIRCRQSICVATRAGPVLEIASPGALLRMLEDEFEWTSIGAMGWSEDSLRVVRSRKDVA